MTLEFWDATRSTTRMVLIAPPPDAVEVQVSIRFDPRVTGPQPHLFFIQDMRPVGQEWNEADDLVGNKGTVHEIVPGAPGDAT